MLVPEHKSVRYFAFPAPDFSLRVKQGDVLLYRSWYEEPANAEVKSVY